MFDFDWRTFLHWEFSDAIESSVYLYTLVLFTVLCSLLILIRKLRKELIPVFTDEQGDVQITPHALHELVKKSCEDIPGVYSPSTSINRKGRNFRLDIRIRIKQDCNIKNTRKVLSDKIEKVMIENLGFTNFNGLDIVIKGFQGAD
ncbi:MAG: hypothetical protein P8P49_08655 [Opitutales bacterium]|nr:hypothetical protein [Opitutales bacterium]